MSDKIDIWSVESKLYAYVDANGMRENYTYSKSFSLGNDHFVDVKLTNFSRNILTNKSVVGINHFVVSMNFRKKNVEEPWFRVDNESRNSGESENYLHFHSTLNGKQFQEHQKIEGQLTIAEIISTTFDSTYKILAEKFQNDVIVDGKSFVGSA